MLQKQILIVEDNELNRAMLYEIISSEYRVLEAENGQVALDILKQHKDDIALILLDVMMPVLDGYGFLDRVKEDAELALIPVIVMTQSEGEDDEVAALTHGTTDFVPKPYRPQVILHRVASIIKLRETAALVNQFQYDRLTGLYSREFFYRKVGERLQENPEQEYTIVCSNVENFKLYNDTFGVPAGDILLQEIADLLRKETGENAVCGRFGADRFMCLIDRSQEQRARSLFLADDVPKMKNMTMKWGIYEIVDRTVPVEQMCDRALLAADSIKGQYNRYFAVYDDALREKLLREQAITEAMDTALRERQFVVYFQPKYSLHDQGLAGAEALVRWVNPELGFLSPAEFIPLFEKNGFISRLDQYVWESVCAQLQEWHRKGYPLLPVSVNVSRADIYQEDLAKLLLEIAQKYDIDPSCLHLEITESAYTENPSQIISTVDRLRKQGFIIEMDDFGSGYSSLNMLNQMKMDILKLDMKFVQNEMEQPVDQGILRFIVELAHWMNLNVVAEGVETREQAERLREMGCDYVQGYFFAKPMPADEFEELLKIQASKFSAFLPEAARNKTGTRNLLVIDEDEEFRKSVCKTFDGRYRILETSDVQSAISCITDEEHTVVSAVILSMTLPEQGATLFLKHMRQNPMLWHIPVLATIPQGDVSEELAMELDTDDFLCKCHPRCDLRRRVERMIEMADCQRREYMLQDEASRDYLTGLLNRRGFQNAMDSIRKEDMPLALFLFDLDDLKMVNDTFGHEEGDKMIQSFAELLRRKTRNDDILCRYGGDEFVVILKRMNDIDVAKKKGADICRSFLNSLPNGHFHGTCSGGIVLCGAEEKPTAELIERADQALYRAKQENKGGCCVCDRNYRGKDIEYYDTRRML